MTPRLKSGLVLVVAAMMLAVGILSMAGTGTSACRYTGTIDTTGNGSASDGTGSANQPPVGSGGSVRPFTHAVISLPYSLDPSSTYWPPDYGVMQNYYETLLWYEGEDANNIIPWLALQVPSYDNGLISSDGLTYTFNLRPGVQFHDGTYMDAYDVEYSIERHLIRYDQSGIAPYLAKILLGYSPDPSMPIDPNVIGSTVTVPSEMTVEVHLAAPYAPFNSIMALHAMSIVSKEYILTNEPDYFGSQNFWMATNEMGTGPYRITSMSMFDFMILERHEGYWRGPAAIPEVHLISRNDLWSNLFELKQGWFDMADTGYNQWSDITSDPSLDLYVGEPSFAIYFAGFNQATQPGLYLGEVPSDFFADQNVRQAFIHAMDMESFITSYYGMSLPRSNGPLPIGMRGYNATVPLQAFDLAAAASCLEAAVNPATMNSWADDGFHLVLYYNYGNYYRQLLYETWEVGLESLSQNDYVAGEIQVDVYGLEFPTYLEAVRSGRLLVREGGWVADFSDPDNFIRAFLSSSGDVSSSLGISDPVVDQMVEDALAEPDEEIRGSMYEDLVGLAAELGHYLWCYQDASFAAMRDWVHGYYANPLYSRLSSNAYYFAMQRDALSPPEAPRNVVATAVGNDIQVTWEAPSGYGDLPVYRYVVYRSDGGGPMVNMGGVMADGSPLIMVDGTVVQGVTYAYCLVAESPVGESPKSATAEATVMAHLEIDIKPNQYPNTIIWGRGVVTVAVLGSSEFTVFSIDRSTVRLAGARPISSTLMDIDGDGDLDLVVRFMVSSLDLQPWSTFAVLTAKTWSGMIISGTDSVDMRMPGWRPVM